jgi:hypothetical protein
VLHDKIYLFNEILAQHSSRNCQNSLVKKAAGSGEGRYRNVNNVKQVELEVGGRCIGGQDNSQLLIILPYIISIYNVQGLQALSRRFLITVNSGGGDSF